MSDFSTAVVQAKQLDRYRRVNYVHGLVLGVDEFLQEEAYLLEKDQLHNRSLHGYGTVCGLAVISDDGSDGPRIKVRSGLAVNPRGEEIRVPVDQCASLNEWLLKNRDDVDEALGSPPLGPLSINVVLCYRECSTERVPIPSGPCQSLEETTKPSRIADDFELQFTLDEPQRAEDEAIREFILFMSQIRISASSPGLEEQELLALIRAEFLPESPPESPVPVSSPPGDWTLHPSVARERLRAAMRLWITEIRPTVGEEGKNCASGPPDEKCVLLARLTFDVGLNELGYFYNDSEVRIDEDDRPYLLSTMLLQERLLQQLAEGDGGAGGVTAHADLSGLADAADHPQYLLIDGNRPLAGPWSVGGQRVMDVPVASDDNDAIPRIEMDNRLAAHAAADEHLNYLHLDNPPGRAMRSELDVGGNRVVRVADARQNRRDALPMTQAKRQFVQLESLVNGPYHIVAGGRFDIDGNAVGNSYNNLRVALAGNVGNMFLFEARYDTYLNPDGAGATHALIVKGTSEGRTGRTFLSVVRFEANSFFVSVGPRNLEPSGFSIEVSFVPGS